MTEEFTINIETLIIHNLSFEAYFILWCLNFKNEDLLLNYIRSCRKIPTDIFNDLEDKDYIIIDKSLVSDNRITYASLYIKDSAKSLFNIQNFDIMFDELRSSYPKEVGPEKRKLHLDLKRCKALYKKIIGTDTNLHILICNCAKIHHNEKKRSNSEIYMQNLATWLFQKNYEQYFDDAKNYNQITIEQSNMTSI